MYGNGIKRLMDFSLALAALALLSVPFLLLALLLALANRGTPFFRQTRPGRGGRLFRIVKFKTMTDARDSRGELLPDEQRLTRAGALVRSLSLDELPQLFNVLAGQMSFIGPRPLLPEYLPLYTAEQARRHDVRPGITGWAQVNGRNAISWERKFELDVWYVDHLNFLLDMRIIFLTLAKVVRRQGISAEGCATMQKFTGSGK
ncbi:MULTISPECIES: sugar transferase [unclassified Akkermansia]|uniref:sugar transferase n=1 Tax=unclassified Akkermansia TaxID=2608915 RepID=UPI00101E8D1D|nr:sugar transferase [Akkermansia sp. BIOML-A67]KAA3150179.1 sugar transferase [Akkermansia sp. BIOML-A64]KAA3154083.1 sugar transferase [Akkermansia sp. BIOML-A62]KAA3154423.1 sugar transferase [Akkermansia sp. BIOML-A65]KAA3163906.1 sugar transferase [Akkermansia sp. BIOML-A60]KAA3165590.1 sugar transferase [Akkermansia sp. BIOML-A63]KAA3168314.1 sugar transferase [Akkermansia sp. BIOML-A58]KAA3173315.1 sugar transferase [Akkermansia sp. BIOML-A61]KAA3173679.1 sugar transferase [Akkermans